MQEGRLLPSCTSLVTGATYRGQSNALQETTRKKKTSQETTSKKKTADGQGAGQEGKGTDPFTLGTQLVLETS